MASLQNGRTFPTSNFPAKHQFKLLLCTPTMRALPASRADGYIGGAGARLAMPIREGRSITQTII
jgi:hypothetical protein